MSARGKAQLVEYCGHAPIGGAMDIAVKSPRSVPPKRRSPMVSPSEHV
jgi:hypothetical protein